ncbi:MAG: NAD-dependent epimerase/dehydratase family protein [Nanoarchaeota archaeon]
MKNKNILVTGGTGFLGGHLVRELIDMGANVFVTYRLINSKRYFFNENLEKNCTLLICDTKDKERIMNVISSYKIDYIFHLAAQPLVEVAYNHPYETLLTNILGTINILEASRNYKNIKGIVVFTSDKAYGNQEILPYYESSPLRGSHPYDCSKSCSDLISQMYYKTYNLPITIVRAGNMFGPGDLNFDRIVPGAIKSILKKEPLEIRSDGSMIRDYVYVKDVVRACIMLMQNIEKTQGEAFNIGAKNVYTVLELLEKIEKIIGVKIEKNILNICKNEIPKQYLSYEKIKNFIGWENSYDLDSAIKETFSWYQSHT